MDGHTAVCQVIIPSTFMLQPLYFAGLRECKSRALQGLRQSWDCVHFGFVLVVPLAHLAVHLCDCLPALLPRTCVSWLPSRSPCASVGTSCMISQYERSPLIPCLLNLRPGTTPHQTVSLGSRARVVRRASIFFRLEPK